MRTHHHKDMSHEKTYQEKTFGVSDQVRQKTGLMVRGLGSIVCSETKDIDQLRGYPLLFSHMQSADWHFRNLG